MSELSLNPEVTDAALPKRPRGRPKAQNPDMNKELFKVGEQFDAFDKSIKDLTQDRMNEAPKLETDSQHKMSQNQIASSKDVYLKPKRVIGPGVNPKTGEREKFNEKFRDAYNYAKEYVQFVAENKELIGESISDIWTKPFGGMNCECWDVPVNTPVWGPRYLAEQIASKRYHRLVMKDQMTNTDGRGQYYGQMAADTTIQRLDAHPVSKKKSVFTGASGF